MNRALDRAAYRLLNAVPYRRSAHKEIRNAGVEREIPRLKHRTPQLQANFSLEIGAGSLFCGIDDLFHRLP
jgi:hypothetical protein